MSLEQKIKELEKYTDDLAHDLADTRHRVKSLEDWQQGLAQAVIAAPKPQAKPESERTPEQAQRAMADLRILEVFPEYLRQHLHVEQNGRIIRNEFVSKEYWTEINTIAKKLGYKWWTNPTDKKQSRWEKQ